MMKPIYLDYNATTPIDPEVAAAMSPYLFEHFGNPSSSHWYGVQTKEAVEKARDQVANLLNCSPDEVVFTGGGSESNNYAIKGAAFANRDKGNHLITSSIEHPAVIEVCRYLEEKDFQVTYLPVDRLGQVDPRVLEKVITSNTVLISIMHANNEVGTIQPITEIAKIAKDHSIVFHTDAAQSVGKIPTRVDDLGVDLLTIAGHKLYGPKGIGALYIRRGTQLEKLIHGADHEQGRRAGTENVLEIVGLGKACEIAKRDLNKNMEHMQKMRDLLYQELKAGWDEIKLNGHPERRLPNTLSVSFRNIEANKLIAEIDTVAVSAGAACHSDAVKVSSVLQAMQLELEYAMGTVRFSTGKMTTAEEVKETAAIFVDTLRRLQGEK
ncbi:MAG: cysteine desulfurase [Deltaproteobacteria bacterium]|nr:MAG: cysteine desulfurase [Deltaproteobacteria bacterium]